jgi:hypothetical protein
LQIATKQPQLCQAAAAEQDSKKLMELLAEIKQGAKWLWRLTSI